MRRLIKRLAKLLRPDEAAEIYKQLSAEYGFKFLGSRAFGGAWLLDGMWQWLRIDKT